MFEHPAVAQNPMKYYRTLTSERHKRCSFTLQNTTNEHWLDNSLTNSIYQKRWYKSQKHSRLRGGITILKLLERDVSSVTK